MEKCLKCGSMAINHNLHGRDGTDGDLCDVCYWRKRAVLGDDWRDARKELPEKYKSIIIYIPGYGEKQSNPDANIRIGHLMNDEYWYIECSYDIDGDFVKKDEVIAWRPLPLAPGCTECCAM